MCINLCIYLLPTPPNIYNELSTYKRDYLVTTDVQLFVVKVGRLVLFFGLKGMFFLVACVAMDKIIKTTKKK